MIFARAFSLTLLAAVVCLAAPARAQEKHYTLKRDVYRLVLDGTPITRVLCTVRDPEGGSADVIVWDPEEKLSNARYALLPTANASAQLRELSCRSESHVLSGGRTRDAMLLYAGAATKVDKAELELELKLAAVTDQQITRIGDSLTIRMSTVTGAEKTRVLQQRNRGAPTSQLRSLDPTTVLINQALTAL
ncbi:MAG TPA: hypothetical protein VK524_08810, partial [Polyangiaceae bacterium]|nr:hypothetical protein [Polyangiaceae bacterium]